MLQEAANVRFYFIISELLFCTRFCWKQRPVWSKLLGVFRERLRHIDTPIRRFVYFNDFKLANLWRIMVLVRWLLQSYFLQELYYLGPCRQQNEWLDLVSEKKAILRHSVISIEGVYYILNVTTATRF